MQKNQNVMPRGKSWYKSLKYYQQPKFVSLAALQNETRIKYVIFKNEITRLFHRKKIYREKGQWAIFICAHLNYGLWLDVGVR